MKKTKRNGIKFLYQLIKFRASRVGQENAVFDLSNYCQDMVQDLIKKSLVIETSDRGLEITQEGRNFLKRALCEKDVAYQRQHQDLSVKEVTSGEKVLINLSESPLGAESRCWWVWHGDCKRIRRVTGGKATF